MGGIGRRVRFPGRLVQHLIAAILPRGRAAGDDAGTGKDTLQAGEAQPPLVILFHGQLAAGLEAEQRHVAVAAPLQDVHGGRLRIPLPFQQQLAAAVTVDVFHAQLLPSLLEECHRRHVAQPVDLRQGDLFGGRGRRGRLGGGRLGDEPADDGVRLVAVAVEHDGLLHAIVVGVRGDHVHHPCPRGEEVLQGRQIRPWRGRRQRGNWRGRGR